MISSRHDTTAATPTAQTAAVLASQSRNVRRSPARSPSETASKYAGRRLSSMAAWAIRNGALPRP